MTPRFYTVNKTFIHTCILIVAVGIAACGGGENYVPKPKGFPRMEFPAKKYTAVARPGVPYQFEMPEYCVLKQDTGSEGQVRTGWNNLVFTPFNATLHLTYYKFNGWAFYDSLVQDTRKLVNKHLQKADDILEEPVSSENGKAKGLVFRIEGNTATNYNFYLTDSSSHFVRGALYFNSKTEQDSIAPIYQFMKSDIEHLIRTFNWK